MNYRWSLAPPQPLLVRRLVEALKLSPLLAQCLVNRGLVEPDRAAAFLAPRLRHLTDPFLLPNMTAAVDRLFAARNRGEPMVIFGDYDVDGVTATALLLEVLRTLGWQVDHYLPCRLDEGYGLSQDGVANCLARCPAKLLLAVDCGSTACAQVQWLRERGVEVIVLDHHQVSDPPPQAVALVNPNLGRTKPTLAEPAGGPAGAGAGLGSPAAAFDTLCSVGLAFKLAHALVKRGRQLGLSGAHAFDLKPLLDLVALGTVADLVPLTGENRILVATGLDQLERTGRPGLQALKRVAQVAGRISPYEVGFQLGPRLNAAGRLETATEALQLLLAPDPAIAELLALSLDARNRERQQIERNLAAQVIGAVRAKFNPTTDYVIVEGQLLWHLGVVGIVASRVLREFYRPTLILGGDGEEWRGSGRSIEGFDLAAALRECRDLLSRHGGHAMAAGLSLRPENIEALRQRLNALARRCLRADQLVPPLRLDGEVSLAELSIDPVDDLQRLEPTGQGNPPVQVAVRGLALKCPPQRLGRDQQHARLWVTDGEQVAEVLWWNCADQPLPAGRFDLACVPQIHDYDGRRSVQLKLLAWRAADRSD